jgi:hypothetical protein
MAEAILDDYDALISEAIRHDAEAAVQALRHKHNLLSPAEVDSLYSQKHHSKAFVEGLLSHNSVSVLIGDSGLGKSALAVQLGLCVAAGVPFLGMKTKQGLAVNVDHENGLAGSRDLRDALIGFLGLRKAPDDFRLWTPDYANCPLAIEEMCREAKPTLVTVDSLRSHDPYFESTEHAGAAMRQLHSTASKHGVAIVLIHHTRKPGPDGPPTLDAEDTQLMHWLNQASGHRAIINQADTRIAADIPSRGRGGELVLRWHRRIYGEGGPIYLERVCNEDADPIGYRRLSGPKLLGNPEQEAAFGKLPSRFAFKEAKQAYERSDDPTRKWLQKCMSLGIVEQPERGLYIKVSQ